MKNVFTTCALIALSLALGMAALASVGFTPPPPENNKQPAQMNMGTIILAPQKAAPKATGTASLICSKDKKFHALVVQAAKLDPKAVYTIWIVKTVSEKKNGKQVKNTVMEGVGTAPYTLKVEKNGSVALSAQEKDCLPYAGWQKLEIVLHPDKNPKNMKNTVPVLVGDITKFVY